MKTLLIMLTTILLISCSPTYQDEPIVQSITRVSYGNDYYNKYKFIVETDECKFYTNKYYEIGTILTGDKTSSIIPLRDYQLDIIEDYCYIYDNTRLVGKCPMKDNMIEQLILLDNQ